MQLKNNVTVIEEHALKLAGKISVLVKVNNETFWIMLIFNSPSEVNLKVKLSKTATELRKRISTFTMIVSIKVLVTQGN